MQVIIALHIVLMIHAAMLVPSKPIDGSNETSGDDGHISDIIIIIIIWDSMCENFLRFITL